MTEVRVNGSVEIPATFWSDPEFGELQVTLEDGICYHDIGLDNPEAREILSGQYGLDSNQIERLLAAGGGE